ncbi:RNA polymerase subunit sigma-24 [Neorhodopirellula pilleata]|nr:RNA polymerase subunit sigma-24 [Neorhodopirellula pilleata]
MADDAHILARLGGQLNATEKASLEEQVAKKPDDVESRTKLLGYYFTKGRQDPDAKAAKERHVRWLIANAPESEVLGLPYSQLDKVLDPEGYDRCKHAWLSVLQKSPENLVALRNASKFFLLHDRRISENFLLKGQRLDAEDPKWPASLGQLYSLGMTSLPMGPVRTAAAAKAFRHYELAYDRSDPMESDSLLAALAATAFEAGQIDDAKKFAEMMLVDDATGWNRGNRIHHGNLVLGRIALTQGRIDEAKSRLLLAGKTNGSPQLNSFGPNMLLAKELLERGEKEVVLNYFELCKEFWKSPRRQLEHWIDVVKSDRIPEFGGNLAY